MAWVAAGTKERKKIKGALGWARGWAGGVVGPSGKQKGK